MLGERLAQVNGLFLAEYIERVLLPICECLSCSASWESVMKAHNQIVPC